MSEATASVGGADQAGAARYTQPQLDQFIAAHERFVRRQANGRRLSMIYLQAPDMDFAGRDLSEADFTGSNLQRARLIRANLERANLFCADLTGADAREASFRRADIRGVSLKNAKLIGAVLDEADMREAMLARADVANGFELAGRSAVAGEGAELVFSVDFTNCSLKRARLNNAKLKGANFTGALLQGANLQGANLLGVKFDGAILEGADLSGARYDPAALAKRLGPPSAAAVAKAGELRERLKSAERWIATNGREGAAAMLDDEDLRPMETAFNGRALTAMRARRVCAIGASFAGAQLQGARFDGADLREADFSGADLRGASFLGANLRHARFERADVRPLPLASGGERNVVLDGADVNENCFELAVRA